MIDFRRGTWDTALFPPPKTTPQKFGSPSSPAGGEFMVGGTKVWRARSEFIYYGNVQRTPGVVRPGALVAERNKGLPGTGDARNEIPGIDQGFVRM